MTRIALVFMDDAGDNFFITDCPNGNPENWIENFVYSIENVEHVEVYELGKMLAHWSNPDSSSEEDF